MSEFVSSHHESPDSERGIQGLRSDFDRYGHNYFSMFVTLRQYIDDHLDFGHSNTLDFLLSLEESGRLPTKSYYDTEPVAALEMHRLAVYTTWMPLFQLSHSSEEFKVWLPHALEVVVPNPGYHTPGDCFGSQGYETPFDDTCRSSLCCPVRHIVRDVVQLSLNAPMNTLDYVLDPLKAHDNTTALIAGVYDYALLPGDKKSVLLAAYQRRYDSTFGPPEATE